MKPLRLILPITLFILSGVLGGCSTCVQSHQEKKYQEPYLQPVMAGKVMMMIPAGGYYYNADICDKYKD